MTTTQLNTHIVNSTLFDKWGSYCVNKITANKRPSGVDTSGSIHGYSDGFDTSGYMFMDGITSRRISRRQQEFTKKIVINVFEKIVQGIIPNYDKAMELHTYLSGRGIDCTIIENKVNCEFCNYASVVVDLKECKTAT